MEINDGYGFPRHDISPTKKNKKWHLQYSKAFHREFQQGNGKSLRWAKEQYTEWRQYARGKQSIDQYKTLLGLKKNNGKWNQTWRNIDWSILPIFPRFKTVIKNRLLKLPRYIDIQAIDQTSISLEKQRRCDILNYINNKEFYESTERELGLPSTSPFEPGEHVPENTSEVDIYMKMYPKNKLIMLMRDQLDLTLYNNDWKQIEDQIINDLIEVGVSGTYTWMDVNGAIRINRVIGEHVISNMTTENDFSDIIRVGRYEQITISQLRARVPKGTFTEEDYAAIAQSASKNEYNALVGHKFFEENNRFPYDHELITILTWECLSADSTAYILTNGKNLQVRENPDWLGDKTDKQYEQYYKAKGENRKVIRDSYNNLYGCVWIVDTDYVYNYGKKTNQIRSTNSLRDVESNYTMYTLDYDSLMRQCIPILNNIQINWLQYQHHLAKSKPGGLAIEKRALGSVDLGNGQKLTSGQVLQMYAETGSYIYVGTDHNGRHYPFEPIRELRGGISDAAKQHLDFIIIQIDILRSILGLNEVTDSSTPDPKIGKAVSEMLQYGTNNALASIYHGFISIYERTLRKISYLVPDSLRISNSNLRNDQTGEQNNEFIKALQDTPFVEFGIKIEIGVTDEMRNRLTQHINASLKSNGGVLLPEDAFIIENEPNIHRAYLLLSQKRRQREQEIMANEMAKMSRQAQGNTETAVMLEREKQNTLMQELEVYKEKIAYETHSKLVQIREKAQWDIIIEKQKQGAALTQKEFEIYQKLLLTDVQSEEKLMSAQQNK